MKRPVVVPANQPPDRFYRGGARIRAFRGHGAPGDRVPEDWVASSTALFGEDMLGLARLPDGRTVREAQEADPDAWFGPDHARQRGADPFLLTKLLDAGERLPVHLHPDDAFARQHLGSRHGKTEAWVVLEGGQVRLGFRRDVTAAELADWVLGQETAAILDAMHVVDITAGDGVLVPAGMPHAIGEGVFVAEVQQPTDLSILLEWQGFEVDGKHLGHLGLGWDLALGAVDRRAKSVVDVERLVVRHGADGRVLPAEASPFFRVARHDGASAGPVSLLPGFRVLIVVEGTGDLSGEEWAPVPLSRGTTVLVPYAAGNLVIAGDVSVVECAPPAPGGVP